MGKKFQPVFPAIEVLFIKDRRDLEKIGQVVMLRPEFFIQLPFSRGPVVADVEDDKLIITSDNGTTLLCETGDYILTSENGARYATRDNRVKMGIFDGLPEKLFTPLWGNAVDEESTAVEEAPVVTAEEPIVEDKEKMDARIHNIATHIAVNNLGYSGQDHTAYNVTLNDIVRAIDLGIRRGMSGQGLDLSEEW